MSKISSFTIGNRARDLPACSATPPRAPTVFPVGLPTDCMAVLHADGNFPWLYDDTVDLQYPSRGEFRGHVMFLHMRYAVTLFVYRRVKLYFVLNERYIYQWPRSNHTTTIATLLKTLFFHLIMLNVSAIGPSRGTQSQKYTKESTLIPREATRIHYLCCKGVTSLRIIRLLYAYCCDDVPVDVRTAETCSAINLKASVFTVYQLWFCVLVYRRLNSDIVTG
jgi:hypothetical protein